MFAPCRTVPARHAEARVSPENSSVRARASSWFAPPLLWTTGLLALFVTAFCYHLWPEWRHNPDLSHGFFTPVLCLLLLRESGRAGPPRWLPAGRALLAGQLLAAAAVAVLFALAGLLAASLGWDHALVDFLLGAMLATALVGGILALADERVRALPFNWISLTAAGLWILAVPLPSGTYARLTVLLQGWVTTNVIGALHLLGVSAQQRGNVIELASTTVGVAEACSGIRSLLSCLYAGFFFAAWQVRSPGRRLVLIVTAPVLAVAMNLLRSLTLTLMANAGWSIAEFWHDATGFAILAITAVILAMMSIGLSSRPEVNAAVAADAATGSRGSPLASRATGGIKATLASGSAVGALILLFAWYAPNKRPAAASGVSVDSLLPTTAEGWQASPTSQYLYQFSSILRTTDLAQCTYFKEIDGQPCQLTVYVAHWNPGQAPVSLVASHTPDACWPGAGWTLQGDRANRQVLALDGRSLPPAEHRVFVGQSQTAQQVWFWHVYDGRVISYRDPYSVPVLLSLALHYGFRREGAQYFIRISSNRSWEQLAGEPLVRQIFGNFANIGLKP